MKPSWEWIEEDILSLIREGVEESINLEYKSCGSLEKTDSKKREISKDVSAFANSAGGTIIYGVIEDKIKPIKIDDGYDPKIISKEWLEQVINSNIQRKISGIIINPVQLSALNSGKVIYVVHIPQSDLAPHMSAEKKYYKRYNFESTAMEEYEVRDISNRHISPDLKILAEISDQKLVFDYTKYEYAESAFSEFLNINFLITNYSPIPAEYSIIHIFVDKRLKVENLPNPQNHHNGIKLVFNDISCEVNSFAIFYSIPEKMPIMTTLAMNLLDYPCKISFPYKVDDYYIHWRIISPRMEPKSGTFILKSNLDEIIMTEEN